jgi:hypothetical protein
MFRCCQWCGDANAYGISTVGAEHRCDGRSRIFFGEAASNFSSVVPVLGCVLPLSLTGMFSRRPHWHARKLKISTTISLMGISND